MSYQQEKFKEIADTIRGFTGKVDKIIPNDFPDEIRGMATQVYQKGVEQGKAEGGGETLPDADEMMFPNDITGKVSTDSQYYDDIATALKEYNSAARETFIPSEMGSAVTTACNNAFITGKSEGESIGYSNGYGAGKEDAQEEFWGKFQNYGNNTPYVYAFSAPNWTDATYTPRYTLKSTNMLRAFYDTNLKSTKVPIDVRSSTSGTPLNNAFRDANLVTIVEIMVNDVVQYNSTFMGCSKLTEIRFSGTIGQNLDISESPLLSDASVASIKEHLKDFPSIGSDEKRSIKFHKNITDRLGENGIAEFEEKGWTVVR